MRYATIYFCRKRLELWIDLQVIWENNWRVDKKYLLVRIQYFKYVSYFFLSFFFFFLKRPSYFPIDKFYDNKFNLSNFKLKPNSFFLHFLLCTQNRENTPKTNLDLWRNDCEYIRIKNKSFVLSIILVSAFLTIKT